MISYLDDIRDSTKAQNYVRLRAFTACGWELYVKRANTKLTNKFFLFWFAS